jgi:HAD superfamily hydrolase (TIGR01509 family)
MTKQTPPFPDIDAVLFDLDGTLIEHTWQLSQITDSLFERFSDQLAPLTCDQFYEVFWPKNTDLWYMMVDGIIDGDTAQLYSYLNTLRALEKDTALAAAMCDTWIELVLAEAVPFDDTTTVLETVRTRYVTGIVTNGFTSMQRAKLNHYGLSQQVDFSLVSEEAGAHKPDPRIFAQALTQAGNIAPERAIFVGDTLGSDIEGAQQAGLHAVFMNSRDDQTPPAGIVKIKALSELLPLLTLV